MRFAAILLSHAGAAREALEPAADLEEIARGLVEAGRAAWPKVRLPADAFLRHVAERLADESDPLQALRSLHTADQYLACACARGDPRALKELDDRFMSQLEAHLGRRTNQFDLTEEIRQALRMRILVGQEGMPPRIAGYSGRGPLGGWLRVSAARLAFDLIRARKQQSDIDRGATINPAAPDPEMLYFEARYAPQFREALEATLASLAARERNVLRLYFLDGLGADAIGRLYRVTERTVQRWIVQTRQHILDATRQLLRERHRLSDATALSLMRLAQAQFGASVFRCLGDTGARPRARQRRS